jgi:hypothetical protein
MFEKMGLFFTILFVHPLDQRNTKRNKIKYEVAQIRKQDMVGRIEGFNVDELYENNSREV